MEIWRIGNTFARDVTDAVKTQQQTRHPINGFGYFHTFVQVDKWKTQTLPQTVRTHPERSDAVWEQLEKLATFMAHKVMTKQDKQQIKAQPHVYP